jgi:hypothetical protein
MFIQVMKALIIRFLFLLTYLVFQPYSFLLAQDNYSYKTFTTESGLPHNTILSIARDSTGFLWFATWNGLSRYDGYEFKNYFHDPDDSTSLPHFSCNKILVDRFNNLWVSLDVGPPVIYDRANDYFIKVINGSENIQFGLTTDNDKNIWLVRKDGIEKYNYKTNLFEKYFLINDDRNSLIEVIEKNSVYFDNQNNLWLPSGISENVTLNKAKIEEGEKIIRVNNKFKLSTEDWYWKNRTLSYFISYKQYISPIGNIWSNTAFGLFLLDPKTSEFKRWKGKPPANEFKGESAFCYYEPEVGLSVFYPDENRNIILNPDSNQLPVWFSEDGHSFWFNTVSLKNENLGLVHTTIVSSFFRTYFQSQNKNGVPVAYFSVHKDRFGDIWAGARNLNHLLRLKPDCTIIRCNWLEDYLVPRVYEPRSFLEDSSGIWIGYYINLLVYFDFKTESFSRKVQINNATNNLEFDVDFHFLSQSDSVLVSGGGKFLYSFYPPKKEIQKRWTGNKIQATYCITRDNSGGFWIGSQDNTVFHFDHQLNEIASYKIRDGTFNVESICLGDSSDIWVALLGGGLGYLNYKTGVSKIYTTSDGLPNNTTYSVLKDKKGNLWISTDLGISRFNPRTEQFRAFGQEDGLKITEFNSDAVCQAQDGEFLFGGMGGVVGFYPDSLNETNSFTNTAPLFITDLKVSGLTRHFDNAIYNSQNVKLSRGDNNFQVSFACLEYTRSEKIKYRYRLSGLDKQFVETDFRHRSVNYARLLPGKYLFEVEATNPDGEWVAKKGLFIEIPPFYYQTWWFWLLIVFFFAGVVMIFAYMFFHQRRLKVQHREDELRLSSLRGQMNPHFVFNTLNSINYFILKNDPLSANRYLADFSRLIRAILRNMSKDFIPFEREIESINDYLSLEYLRFGDKFDYKIDIDKEIVLDSFDVFPGMVQPFIENAIWHGVKGLESRKGFVNIRFKTGKPGCFICIVEDDGIGRKMSESRKSNITIRASRGIAIILERLDLINKLQRTDFKVIVEDLFPERQEAGTRVIIEIPTRE